MPQGYDGPGPSHQCDCCKFKSNLFLFRCCCTSQIFLKNTDDINKQIHDSSQFPHVNRRLSVQFMLIFKSILERKLIGLVNFRASQEVFFISQCRIMPSDYSEISIMQICKKKYRKHVIAKGWYQLQSGFLNNAIAPNPFAGPMLFQKLCVCYYQKPKQLNSKSFCRTIVIPQPGFCSKFIGFLLFGKHMLNPHNWELPDTHKFLRKNSCIDSTRQIALFHCHG